MGNAVRAATAMVLWALLVPAPVFSQTTGSPLHEELDRLGRTATALDNALPSFACEESGTSEVRRGRKVLRRVAFVASLRAIREASGAHLENYTVTSIDGKPYSGDYAFGYYVSGGFDQGMRYFAPGQQVCYVYTLRAGRIDFVTAPDLAAHPACRDEGMRGFALLDQAGEATHVERTVSEEAGGRYHLAHFSAIDFTPVELNGQVFRLSSHLHAEEDRGRFHGIFDVSYTGCRLFHVSVTVEPPTTEPDTPGPLPEGTLHTGRPQP